MISGHYIDETDIAWPSGTTDADKQLWIDTAEALFDEAVGEPYWPKPFDIKLNGNRKNRLFIPLRGNILTVTWVDICGLELDADWYENDASSIYLSCESAGALDIELSYLLDWDYGNYLFPEGLNNIHVIGTYGHDPTPAWVIQAVKMIVEDQLDPTLYAHFLQSESIGNYSYNIGSGTTIHWYTGILQVDRLLTLFAGKGKGIIMAP